MHKHVIPIQGKQALRLLMVIASLVAIAWSVSRAHASPGALPAQTLQFSGYEWMVRAGNGGPGPNEWDANNVWVDTDGYLHLKISNNGGQWTCAEVTTTERLGFGRYQFQVIGALDHLDRNVVLGLFNYPTPDVGADGTNEIDIEFAQWGNAAYPHGNYTVWAAKQGFPPRSQTFDFALGGMYSTQRFTWSRRAILFQSLHGHRNGNRFEFARWQFAPKAYRKRIPQNPLPAHINLWLFQGNAPGDNQEVELIIKRFTFIPE